MPIDVFVPRESLDADKTNQLANELTESLLRWTDASDDEFIRSNVSVFVHELPEMHVFAGGKPARVARVDVKVPTVALTTQERKAGFTQDATASLRRAANPRRSFDHVWVFVANAVEGGWGIDGRALTSEDLS